MENVSDFHSFILDFDHFPPYHKSSPMYVPSIVYTLPECLYNMLINPCVLACWGEGCVSALSEQVEAFKASVLAADILKSWKLSGDTSKFGLCETSDRAFRCWTVSKCFL